MTPDETAASYDQLAERIANVPRAYGIALHERAIAFVKDRRRALDVGCGSSGRIIELLEKHGFVVEGVDVSRRMVELARKRHPAVPVHHADICNWKLPGKFDFISAWDSTWHVPLMEQEAVLWKLLDGLSAGGVCIFTMGGLDKPSEKTDSAMGAPLYYSTPGIPAVLDLISRSGCVCRHLEYDQHPEEHLCVIAQKAST
jgi:SAM-dependent methyltransferase